VSTRTIFEAAERLGRGEFDLVAVGRGMIADPEWVTKVREGRFTDLNGFSVDMPDTLS
jgi:2,4-dienoyl-CoA reductase-like NADH-dependent reductase (Old Yellow Enzyme family)